MAARGKGGGSFVPVSVQFAPWTATNCGASASGTAKRPSELVVEGAYARLPENVTCAAQVRLGFAKDVERREGGRQTLHPRSLNRLGGSPKS